MPGIHKFQKRGGIEIEHNTILKGCCIGWIAGMRENGDGIENTGLPRKVFNKTREQVASIKAMYGYPLTHDFREKLCNG